ncbi:MAG: pyridoxamine 5'-phosphate oxidase family protein [Saprospiraceae bacterium]|nr:pyridoxamine 5'-phosphate oxidase family protein [Saprospiraceae bacterium]
MVENTIIINQITYDLTELEVLTWGLLKNGAVKPKDGFHTACVATVDEDNEATARTVILRKSDGETKTLFFHTDTRSRKFQHLKRNPKLTLLFYDAHRHLQLSIKTKVSLYEDGKMADERWHTTHPKSRRSFMTLQPPGAPTELPLSGYEKRFDHAEPTDAESNIFRDNFAVVACKVVQLEFLYLNNGGNRRAVFNYENSLCVSAQWLVP